MTESNKLNRFLHRFRSTTSSTQLSSNTSAVAVDLTNLNPAAIQMLCPGSSTFSPITLTPTAKKSVIHKIPSAEDENDEMPIQGVRGGPKFFCFPTGGAFKKALTTTQTRQTIETEKGKSQLILNGSDGKKCASSAANLLSHNGKHTEYERDKHIDIVKTIDISVINGGSKSAPNLLKAGEDVRRADKTKKDSPPGGYVQKRMRFGGFLRSKHSTLNAQQAVKEFPQILPDSLLHKCFRFVENPFEFLRIGLINKGAREFVKSEIETVTQINVRRVLFEYEPTESIKHRVKFPGAMLVGDEWRNRADPVWLAIGGDDPVNSLLCVLESPQMQQKLIDGMELFDANSVLNNRWFLHPKGYRILMRFVPIKPSEEREFAEKTNADNVDENKKSDQERQNKRLEIIVAENWIPNEASTLCKLLYLFRHVKHISIDAPIIEMLIASLSPVVANVHQWYLFQCYLKAIRNAQLHWPYRFSTDCKRKGGDVHVPQQFWPFAESITIRFKSGPFTVGGSSHLGRLLDYSVRPSSIFDRCRLDALNVVGFPFSTSGASAQRNLALEQNVKTLWAQCSDNVYQFRCWAGTPGFDERFRFWMEPKSVLTEMSQTKDETNGK